MTLYLWQSTASVNAGADPFVNWVEGQPPPTVNNSARSMMAAFAKYRDDMGGAVAAIPDPPGQGVVFGATSFQNFAVLGPSTTTLNDGQLITIVPQYSSDNNPQVIIDALDYYPLLNATGNAIIEGQLLQFVPYLFRFKQSNNSLYLENAPADLDQSVPVGAILLYAGTIEPSDKFMFCDGRFLDQTTYATLFALIGDTYLTSSGDENTFQIPNLQGLTIIGERSGSGAIPRSLTTATGDATIPGTVNGWTIVLPYIIRVI